MTSKDGKEIELSHPEDAITAVKFDPANPNLLLVSSWDKTVKLYNLSNPSPTEPISVYPHPSPVLDVCFGTGKNAGRGYTASLDRGVREIDLSRHLLHPPRIRGRIGIRYLNQRIMGSIGCTTRPKSSSNKQYPNQICSLTLPNLPAKVFCLDASKDKLVVAMVNDQFNSNPNLATTETVVPPPPLQERESSLKFMTRAIKCMPRGDGYASGSIEGRVAVDLFDTSTESQAKKYAFKCHRQVIDGVDTIYPVNALAFHPTFGTFATGGGDGIVSIWDSAAKKRLRQLPKYPGSITSLAFNSDGSKLAIACSILEEENPANNPNNNETDHSSDPNNKKESSDEDMKDSSAAPAAAGDPDKKIDSHINSLKNCVFIRNVIDDCKPRTKMQQQ
ncbi:hypothetical protein H4Q26_016816 [Puccinia striiformis f. sp. tritici PST-130]|nr:hypothetical protein H4Q26_016816 [Puccinia striiformis f. sp. tritici PST-130]